MKVLLLSLCALGLLSVTPSEATFGLAAALPAKLFAAAPALAAVGGISAVKILKVIGLSKLKSSVASGISGIGSVLDSFGDDEYDEYYNYRPQPYGPPHLTGPPIFYVIPKAHYDKYRFKRDLQAVEMTKPAQVITEEDYFNVISTMDVDTCVQNLVCELSQMPSDQLKEDEKLIISIFSSKEEPTPSSRRTAKGIYEYAAWLGQRSANNPGACRDLFYTKCNSSAQEIMQAYRNTERKVIQETHEAMQNHA